jgi:uncharacterized membrane protein
MSYAGPRDSFFPVLKNEIRAVRTALWFRPTAFCILAVLAALLLATVGSLLPYGVFGWLPDVQVGAVQDLLKLLASGMLTVATVTLSVLMLVLSIAAGQASPRTVPEVMADPVTQNALGTFLATFVYSLTALLLFGLEAVEGPGVTLVFFGALLLAVNAVRYLVQWIHHVAESLKVNRIVHRVHRQATAVLDAYLAENEAAPADSTKLPAQSGQEPIELRPEATGYVQLIDARQLQQIAEELELEVEVCLQEGDFIHPQGLLMKVLGDRAGDEGVLGALRATVVIGFERSHEGDPRLGFELLAEVACRALSPGINDPQTALVCINYLGSLLARAGKAPAQDYPAATSPDGRVRYRRADFAALLERALRPVVREGAGSAEVICAVLQCLADLASSVSTDHLDELLVEARRAEAFGEASLCLKEDKEALQALVTDLRERVEQRR